MNSFRTLHWPFLFTHTAVLMSPYKLDGKRLYWVMTTANHWWLTDNQYNPTVIRHWVTGGFDAD